MTRSTALALALGCSVGCSDGTADTAGDPDAAPSDGGDPPVALLQGIAPAASGLVPSVVTLRPADDGPAVERGAPPAIRPAPMIDQFGLQFSPTSLSVDVGVPLVFTNSEGALAHNVHVRSIGSGESLFDEDANSGDELRLTLPAAGGYDVLCDMHPGMSAFVFATDDPYVVLSDADGTFSFQGVPAGAYELRLWTADAGFGSPERVVVPAAGVDVDLRTTR